MTSLIFNQLAQQDFEHAMRKVFWRNLLSRLTRKCNHLLSFAQVRQCLPFKGQHYLGLQTVPLDHIVGSEGHYRDFDRAFFPRQERTRARWISIDRTYYEQVSLPPVELTKISERFFVRDGNHRVSVARARGQKFIDAYVTEIDLLVPVDLFHQC